MSVQAIITSRPAERPLRGIRRESVASKINAGHLIGLLSKHADGKVELSDTQIRAAQTLLDRVVPKLSAVEQTIVDERDTASEGDIMAKLAALCERSPGLLQRLNAYMASKPITIEQAPAEAADTPRDVE